MCLLFAAVRLAWPSARVDSTTIWLVVMAAIVYLIPEWIPLVDSFEFGRLKVVIRKEVRKLGEEIEEATESVAQRGRTFTEPGSLNEITRAATYSPRAALMLLATSPSSSVMGFSYVSAIRQRRKTMPNALCVRVLRLLRRSRSCARRWRSR
jgi:hypothetical protein